MLQPAAAAPPGLHYIMSTGVAAAAGVVAAVGDDVAGVAVGDRVYTLDSRSGTYAQFALCARRDVLSLPPALTQR